MGKRPPPKNHPPTKSSQRPSNIPGSGRIGDMDDQDLQKILSKIEPDQFNGYVLQEVSLEEKFDSRKQILLV